jgi:small subunit ribosomal protein S20
LANHKSALKRARQNELRRQRNKAYRTRVKHAVKQVRAAVERGSPEQSRQSLAEAVSIIQRTAGKGVMHKRQAARRISRLACLVNRMDSA